MFNDTYRTQVTIPNGLKPRYHTFNLVGVFIAFVVYFDFPLQILCLFSKAFIFSLIGTLTLGLTIFSFIVMNCVHLHCQFWSVNLFMCPHTFPWTCACKITRVLLNWGGSFRESFSFILGRRQQSRRHIGLCRRIFPFCLADSIWSIVIWRWVMSQVRPIFLSFGKIMCEPYYANSCMFVMFLIRFHAPLWFFVLFTCSQYGHWW